MSIIATACDRVPRNLNPPQYATWQEAMKDAVRDPIELCRLLALPRTWVAEATAGVRDFPLFVPRAYLSRMRPGDPHDPLLRQVLPLRAEHVRQFGDRADPVEDGRATLRPGLLGKYRSRVLMVTTGACAVHCRYCFRRHFPYGQTPRSPAAWQETLAQIAGDTSLREVILSGGDPLTLIDDHLATLAARLANIPHVRRLRIHTRLPIMIPERVTGELLDWLRGGRLTPIMVVHANHAAEIDTPVAEALGRLVDAGVPLLNQAVLLRGVNDSADALVALCERLVDLRVMPYYLHQLDRVAGAAHFGVSEREGLQLIRAVRARLPGYAVPRYVREVPAQQSKVVLA